MCLEKRQIVFPDACPKAQKVYKLVADEFLILDVSSDEVRDAEKLYDKVRVATDRFIEANEFKVMYTVSGGIVPFAALEGNQYSEALKLTDFALNEAKKLGRNRCYIFDRKPTDNFSGRGRSPRNCGML